MGSVFGAQCSCGYASDELTEGCGFAGVCWELAACLRCRRLVSIRAGEHPRCPRCRGPVALLDIQDLEMESPGSAVGDRRYRCPACGKDTLYLELMGLWD